MLNSQVDRVQPTMFPNDMGGGEEVPTSGVPPNQQTNLQRLAQPTQILKATVSNLANYQVSTLKQTRGEKNITTAATLALVQET